METMNYLFKIGSYKYEIPVKVSSSHKDSVSLDAEDFLRAQWDLGKKIIRETLDAHLLEPEIFNFLIEISGLTVTEIAEFTRVDPTSVSQWRSHTKISSTAWQTFRIFFLDLFSNGKITHEIFILNAEKKRIA